MTICAVCRVSWPLPSRRRPACSPSPPRYPPRSLHVPSASTSTSRSTGNKPAPATGPATPPTSDDNHRETGDDAPCQSNTAVVGERVAKARQRRCDRSGSLSLADRCRTAIWAPHLQSAWAWLPGWAGERLRVARGCSVGIVSRVVCDARHREPRFRAVRRTVGHAHAPAWAHVVATMTPTTGFVDGQPYSASFAAQPAVLPGELPATELVQRRGRTDRIGPDVTFPSRSVSLRV